MNPIILLRILFVKLIPVLYWGEAGYLFEHVAEGFGVGVAHIKHDFIDIFAAAFQLTLSGFYLYALHVLGYGIVGGFFKTPLKTAPAQVHFIGQLLHR